MIKIEIDFVDNKKFENLIRYIENNALYGEMQIQAQILAHHTADSMIDIIASCKKRPDKGTNKLENAITAEQISTTGGIEYGIGRITKLMQEAPYFQVLNDGGYVPNHGNFVPLGAFAPGEEIPNQGSFREGQWSVGAGKYTFKPKRAIEGIEYINKAIINLDKELKEVMESLGSKIIEGMSKA